MAMGSVQVRAASYRAALSCRPQGCDGCVRTWYSQRSSHLVRPLCNYIPGLQSSDVGELPHSGGVSAAGTAGVVAQPGHCSYKAALAPQDCGGENGPGRILKLSSVSG